MYVYQPAGFLKRGTAAFIDAALLFTLTQLVSYLLYGHILIPLSDFINMFFPLYFIFIPAVWNGFTLGKRAVRIRISSVYRDGAGIGSMLLRYFGAVLFAFITLGIGIIVSAFMAALREDKRTVHDFISGTYVTSDLSKEPAGKTPFNNRKVLTAAGVLILILTFTLDRFQHTTYEAAVTDILREGGAIDSITIKDRRHDVKEFTEREVLIEDETVFESIQTEPGETKLRKTGDSVGTDYYIHIKQERNDHFLVIGENGITIGDSDYEILGENTPRRLLENLELDWEVTVR